MGISARYYLFEHDRPYRFSKRVVDGLTSGIEVLPEYAKSRQKIAAVILESENGQPKHIIAFEGTIFHFDDEGGCQKSLAVAGMQALETYEAVKRAQRANSKSAVVDIRPQLNRKKWENDNSWTLTEAQKEHLRADIFGGPNIKRRIKLLKTTSVKAPPITYEAKRALEEIETKIMFFDDQLELLTEPALKGIAFEAAKRARDLNNPMWSAISARAERRREILSRHRTGRGKWIAYVETMIWEGVGHRQGRSGGILAQEECSSRDEAVIACRKLLAANADHFAAYTEVEAKVTTDLEFFEFEKREGY